MVVPVDTDPKFCPGIPAILFQGTYFTQEMPQLISQTAWDIHPDGKRFLMINPIPVTGEESSEASTAAGSRKIVIVTNWFEELKQKVPVD